MVRLVLELIVAYLLVKFVINLFRDDRPSPPPPPNHQQTDNSGGAVTRRKKDDDDYIDYEEVK